MLRSVLASSSPTFLRVNRWSGHAIRSLHTNNPWSANSRPLHVLASPALHPHRQPTASSHPSITTTILKRHFHPSRPQQLPFIPPCIWFFKVCVISLTKAFSRAPWTYGRVKGLQRARCLALKCSLHIAPTYMYCGQRIDFLRRLFRSELMNANCRTAYRYPPLSPSQRPYSVWP